jgi:hypothetical protein
MGSLRNRYILFKTLIYLVLGLSWIFLSDELLSIFADINSIYWLSTAKGVFFIFATAFGLFFVLRAMPKSDDSNSTHLHNLVLSGAPIARTSAWLTYTFAIIIPFHDFLTHENWSFK